VTFSPRSSGGLDRNCKFAALGFAAAFAVVSASAQENVYFQIGAKAKGLSKVSLGLPSFAAKKASSKEDSLAAHALWDVVRSDLLLSRYFDLVTGGPIYDGKKIREIEAPWAKSGASYLLVGSAHEDNSGVTLEARLVATANGDLIVGKSIHGPKASLRRVAHRLSDEVVMALTGKPGIAQSRVAFSNDSTGHREIYIVDYDGAGLTRLTNDASLDLLPRFSPDGRFLVYTSYKNKNPDLFQMDLETGRVRLLSDIQGLNVAGGFSPHGSRLLMTVSSGSTPSIYLKFLKTGKMERLTHPEGADSSPTFSPDGGQAAFVSDRAGNPEIYLLDLLTLRSTKVTALNWCDSPSWAPTGEWIAFAGREIPEDPIDIFLTDMAGRQPARITRGEGSNEDPRWSADGRFIAFSSDRSGRYEIYVMDGDGSAPHRLVSLPGSSITPDWSK
jgi:TolB protein